MKIKNVTTIATIASILLWVAAAFLLEYSTASFGIVSILAAFAQMISIESARREGVIRERRRWFVDKILDEVSDDE